MAAPSPPTMEETSFMDGTTRQRRLSDEAQGEEEGNGDSESERLLSDGRKKEDGQ